MKIGFATIYSWRPHVEHCYFLAKLAEKAGCETYFLQCNTDLQRCYNHELKISSAQLECLKCRLGNLSTYTNQNIASIGSFPPQAEHQLQFNQEWVHSSASTLARFESNQDYESPQYRDIVERLAQPASVTYSAARQWIQSNRLKAICVFNGRIDHTRAVFEAARAEGVKVFSMERPWFSRGIQIYPEEHCLGLRTVHRLVAEWSSRPLSKDQAFMAASYAARRFLKLNSAEWRTYNTDAAEQRWPLNGSGARVLILPSSRNEIWGHPDWMPAWSEPTVAYDAVINKLRLDTTQILLRCHPNWSECIGKTNGDKIKRYYNRWAQSRGILSISSENKANTLDLIKEADIVLLGNGSAAFEAGVLGKTIIATSPSPYSQAGFTFNVHNETSLDSLPNVSELISVDLFKRTEIARRALRYAYTMTHRIPQYVDQVVPASTTQMQFDTTADPARFINLLNDGVLRADDETFSNDNTFENQVLEMIKNQSWEEMLSGNKSRDTQRVRYRPIERRLGFNLIAKLRPLLARGDR
jgi:hypothetical protein